MKHNDTDQSLVEWRRRIREQAKSGLSQAEYCRQNGLSDKALYYWMRKIKRADRLGIKRELFLELDSGASRKSSEPPKCRICLPGEITIEVPFGADVRWLGELMAGFRGR